MMRFLFAMALTTLVASTNVQAAVILVPDGGFESPTIASSSYSYNTTGGLWTFGSTSGIINGFSAFGNTGAPEGSQVAFLQTNTADPHSTGGPGTISQTFNIATAGTYQLNLLDELRPGYLQSSFTISIGGAIVATVTPTTTASFTLFTTGNFTLGAGNTTLTFTSTGPTDSTSFIDNVYLTTLAVPEPASIAMLGMGLLVVGGFAAKKARRTRNS